MYGLTNMNNAVYYDHCMNSVAQQCEAAGLGKCTPAYEQKICGKYKTQLVNLNDEVFHSHCVNSMRELCKVNGISDYYCQPNIEKNCAKYGDLLFL